MGTLEDLQRRLFNIGQLISEILGSFSYVKLPKSELDIAFHNLDTGKIEEVLDDLKTIIQHQRSQYEGSREVSKSGHGSFMGNGD